MTDALPGDDILGMTCCGKGRVGDGHGCYDEVLLKQQRERARRDPLTPPPARSP